MQRNIELEMERGTRYLSITTESCLSSLIRTPGWHAWIGRALYFSMHPVSSYPTIKNVKHVASLHGLSILAAHGESVDTIILRDVDKMCPEFMVLLYLLRYWNRHRVLILSPTPPPLSFLESFFPGIVGLSLCPRIEPEVHYLTDEIAWNYHSFHYQRHKFEEWFFLKGAVYHNIMVFVATKHQCDVVKFYFEILQPDYHVVVLHRSNRPTVSMKCMEYDGLQPMVVIRTDYGDDVPSSFRPDLVVDFGRFKRKFRCYYGDVEDCPQNVMIRRQRCVKEEGTVFRVMPRSEFENRPVFYAPTVPEEWIPWSFLFLASLNISSFVVLGIDQNPLEKWNMRVEGSSRKRLKTLLQYPFSIRCHLMLERCRTFPVQNESQRIFIILAITLINWFDHFHRFLISTKTIYELKYIYGNDDELFIHMRIALLLLSGSPLVQIDFSDAESTSEKLCQHFHMAIRLVYSSRCEVPLLPSSINEEEKDVVRYFLMTDPRVEQRPFSSEAIQGYWNTISYFPSFTYRNNPHVLLLCTVSENYENEPYATLWTLMPSKVLHFKKYLGVQIKARYQWACEKDSQKKIFHQGVIRYFQQVLSLCMLEPI